MRAWVLAVCLALVAPSAWAFEGPELAGNWICVWSDGPIEAPAGGGPLTIAADGEDGLDGSTRAPGLDGSMYGEWRKRSDGTVVWAGYWIAATRMDTTRGTFEFVFTDANTFTGHWSTEDGEIQRAIWNGRRQR